MWQAMGAIFASPAAPCWMREASQPSCRRLDERGHDLLNGGTIPEWLMESWPDVVNSTGGNVTIQGSSKERRAWPSQWSFQAAVR